MELQRKFGATGMEVEELGWNQNQVSVFPRSMHHRMKINFSSDPPWDTKITKKS